MRFDQLSRKWQEEAVRQAIEGFEELYLNEGIEEFELNENSPEVQEYLADHLYMIVYDRYTDTDELVARGRY